MQLEEIQTEEEISIHALREEGDLPELPLTAALCDFYPRPPRGGRPGTSSIRSRFWM